MADLGDFSAAAREHARESGELDTFTFYGRRFALSTRLAGLPLLRLAEAAEAGTDDASMEGLAAQSQLLRGCLSEIAVVDDEGNVLADGWPEFAALLETERVELADLAALTGSLVRVMIGRPTKQPSDSPASLSPTSPTSKSDSVSAREAWDERMRREGMVPVEEAAARLASSG